MNLTPEEFDAELSKRMETLGELFAEGNRLQSEIDSQLKKVRLG